jgi:ABC-type sugar transport system substrate-binding protein
MKKFLVLVLALTLAFALAAPAMAFTSDEETDDDTPYGLDIYLVEYDDDDMFGYISLPARPLPENE